MKLLHQGSASLGVSREKASRLKFINFWRVASDCFLLLHVNLNGETTNQMGETNFRIIVLRVDSLFSRKLRDWTRAQRSHFNFKVSFPLTFFLFDLFTAYGRLITVGSNRFGQLGVGDFKPRAGPSIIGGEMVGKKIVHAACGDDFTVVATAGKRFTQAHIVWVYGYLLVLFCLKHSPMMCLETPMVSAIAKVRNNGEHEHTVTGKFNQGDGPGKKLKFFRCLADTVI